MLWRSIAVTLLLLVPGSAGAMTLDFWLADGNGSSEDRLVKYDDVNGISYPTDFIRAPHLTPPSQNVYGWPSDFVRIGQTVYGVDTFWQQIYTLDNEITGWVTPVPNQRGDFNGPFKGLGSLAYDPLNITLYSIDGAYNRGVDQLVSIDLMSGMISTEFAVSFTDVRGLAFNDLDGLLYVYDKDLLQIWTLDPISGATEFVVTPLHDIQGGFYSELTFFDGELYAPFIYDDVTGMQFAQLRQIDLTTGAVLDLGPEIADISAHALLINQVSLPEPQTLLLLATAALLGRRRLVRALGRLRV